jgi:hypothetical protein
MPIVAKAGGDYVPAPEGSHPAVCVDVVDLGLLPSPFTGEKKHMLRLIWQIDALMDNGKPFTVSRRYTLSLHRNAALRADIQNWRGRMFTDAELSGFDVESLIGSGCLLTIAHVVREGSTYANVETVLSLPRGMEAPASRDYVRIKDRPSDSGLVSSPRSASPSASGKAVPPKLIPDGVTDDDVLVRQGRSVDCLWNLKKAKSIDRIRRLQTLSPAAPKLKPRGEGSGDAAKAQPHPWRD